MAPGKTVQRGGERIIAVKLGSIIQHAHSSGRPFKITTIDHVYMYDGHTSYRNLAPLYRNCT